MFLLGRLSFHSYPLSFRQFVSEAETLYHTCKHLSTPRFHVHYFPRLNHPDNADPYDGKKVSAGPSENTVAEDPEDASFRELSVAEAVALLEHRTYSRPGPSIFQRIYSAEQWLRGPSSVYAAKTAAATSVFAVLILHPVPRQWFISFGMVGGALTIVTALQPTL